VTTGSTLQSPGYAVATYPVKVENGKILVAIGQP
jgi:nitrite reductase/ring-hydroxylating ferredoxin subunit